MSQEIVAFTGLSGVGKTTFLRRLAEHVTFQHLTGGSLVATARKVSPYERDAMRNADLAENQRLLIEGFTLARDPVAPLVIMDGHVVIDGSAGLQKLSPDVFRALAITKLVHLEAEPERISANRTGDNSRTRPAHDLETLSQHQESSRSHAESVAATLDIEFFIVTHCDIAKLASALIHNLKYK